MEWCSFCAAVSEDLPHSCVHNCDAGSSSPDTQSLTRRTFRTVVCTIATPLISLKISGVGKNGEKMEIRLLVAAMMSLLAGWNLRVNGMVSA